MIRNPFIYIVTSNIFMFYYQHYPSYPAGDSGRMGHFSGGDWVRKGVFDKTRGFPTSKSLPPRCLSLSNWKILG